MRLFAERISLRYINDRFINNMLLFEGYIQNGTVSIRKKHRKIVSAVIRKEHIIDETSFIIPEQKHQP